MFEIFLVHNLYISVTGCIALVGEPKVCDLTENSSYRCQLHYIDGNRLVLMMIFFAGFLSFFYSEQQVDKLLNAHPVI